MAQLVTADETIQHQSDRNEDLKCRLQAYEEKVEVLRAQVRILVLIYQACPFYRFLYVFFAGYKICRLIFYFFFHF